MKAPASEVRYAWPAVLLHWLQAAGIVWLLWLGWTMVDLPKGAERSALHVLHKSVGLLMLVLVAARLGWRFSHPQPVEVGGGWKTEAARQVHRALYVFLVATPVAGYLATAFTPYALKFFGIEVPRLFAPDEAVQALCKSAHALCAWSLAGLAAIHVVGALQHLFLRDGVAQRMSLVRLFRN